VFVIAWLNAVLQPCLMAMELSPHEQSPAALGQDHSNHANHSASMEDHDREACPHCPAATSHDNGTCSVAVMLDCDRLPDAKKADRSLKVDLSDAFNEVYFVSYHSDLKYASANCPTIRPGSLKPTFLVGPPLRIRNCVFRK
jgi:hypothetical protein